ncbi:MAG TPA: tetratricopeptide repeat protein [Candidatus Eisenbacteria bacterium]|nr:tetratricopeptide repeat protein [Candidatus Eisenbacteria bacterium]
MGKPPKGIRPRRSDAPPRAKSHAPRRGAILLAVAGIAAITVAAFSGAFGHAFVSLDDPTCVTQNPLVLQQRYGPLLTAMVNNSYHPLTMLSLAMNASKPLSAEPFLVTNVVLHALNTVLVFWLAYLLSRRRVTVAIVAALLFGIHPMRVESVAWVSSRKDVLYAFFFLAGLIAYWRYLEERRWPWLLSAFVLFVCSCLSKGMAVVFPLVLVLLDFWKRRPLLDRRSILEKAPFFAVSLLFGLIALDAEAGRDFHGLLPVINKELKATLDTTTFTPYERVVYPTYGFMTYAWRVLAPVNLGVFYPYPTPAEASHWTYPFSIVFFAGAIALTAWSVRRARTVAFGVGWYLLVILPVLQWVPIGASMLADRMTYVAYFGLFFLLAMGVGWLFDRYRASRVPLLAGIAVALALCFVLTTRQVDTWRNSDALWTNVIRIFPRCDLPYISRGNGRGEAGQIEGALADLRTAMRLGSQRADMYEGLGNAYASIGKADSAVIMFDLAIKGNAMGRTFYNRAIAQLIVGRPREALADLEKALQLMPMQAPTLHFPRGNAYMQLGMNREAIAEFTSAIAAGQLVPDALYNRGVCKLRVNDAAGAVADFQETLRIAPNYTPALDQMRALGK